MSQTTTISVEVFPPSPFDFSQVKISQQHHIAWFSLITLTEDQPSTQFSTEDAVLRFRRQFNRKYSVKNKRKCCPWETRNIYIYIFVFPSHLLLAFPSFFEANKPSAARGPRLCRQSQEETFRFQAPVLH